MQLAQRLLVFRAVVVKKIIKILFLKLQPPKGKIKHREAKGGVIKGRSRKHSDS